MKKEEIINKTLKSQKQSFREHQRKLSFTEKMQIAFSLAKRDNQIRQAVLLPKQKNEKSK